MIITDGAKTYIEQMMKDAGISTLRFASEEGGCCGPSFRLTLDEPQENDIMDVINNVKIAIDPLVGDKVIPITLDIVIDEDGTGLVINGGSSCC